MKALFYFFLLVFFWQTRLNWLGPRLIDYQIPFVYLTDLLLAALLLITWPCLARGVRQQGRIFLLALIFLGIIALGNAKLSTELTGWYRWGKLALFFLFAFWLPAFLRQHQIPLSQTVRVLSWGLVLGGMVALGEFLRGGSLGLQFLGEWRFSLATPGVADFWLGQFHLLRPYATFPHPNVLGGVFAVFANWQLWKFFVLRKQRALKLFLFFSLVLLVSFSRSAWLGFLLGLLWVVSRAWGKFKPRVFFTHQLERLRRLNSSQKLGAVLGLGLGGLLAGAFLTIVAWRLTGVVTGNSVDTWRRIQLNQIALEIFRAHPGLGVGLGNFTLELEKYARVFGPSRFIQPVHNIWLLILAELGLAGFLAWVLFLAYLWLNWRSAAGADTHRLGRGWVVIAWLGILTISLLDHYWWTLQAGQLFLFLTIGLTLYTMKAGDYATN